MKFIIKAIIAATMAWSVSACGVKGDVKPPSSTTSTSNFIAR
ncbi:lipoprotein [Kordiimonas aquimaris]|nr:hypothetical protein [Kordiimonas aquimaris]